jgi:Flp pilus assembly protein TadD
MANSCMPMILALITLSLALGFQKENTPPESIRQHMRAAQGLLSEGKAQAAAREFQAILAMDPNNIDARVDLGVLAYFQHDCGLAAPNLRKALSLAPSLPKAQALLGLCEERQGNFDEAANDLKKSFPNLGDSNLATLVGTNLVEIYYRKGYLNRAARAVAELQRAHPTDVNILFMDYRIHAELAERARDTLALVAPDSARMHELMAEQFVNRGDAAEAIVQYKKALARDPGLPGVHYELGEATLQNSTSAESLVQAEHQFRAALEENPNNAGAEAKLGRIAMLRGNGAQAQEEYQRALILDPNQIDALKGMGGIYARKGDSETALKYFLHASQSAPLDDSVHYQLASLYRKLGRTGDAGRELAAFQKLRTIKNDTSLAQQRSQEDSSDTGPTQAHH